MATNQPQNAPSQNAQAPNSLVRAFGPRKTLAEDVGDVSIVLGAVLSISGSANIALVLVEVVISLKFPKVAPLIGLSVNLPTLLNAFLATFPLMFSTSVLMILVFRKVLLHPIVIAIAMIIVFSFAVWLGEILGISDFRFHDVNTNGISAGQFTIPLAFLIAFYTKYGAYKFFTSILTGTAIAWAVSIKLIPHLRERTDKEDHHPKSGTS